MMQPKVTFTTTLDDMKKMQMDIDKINFTTAKLDIRVIIEGEGISENGVFKKVN